MAKANVDLSKLSLDELQTLARDVETEIVTRRETERERVLQQMRELAASIGTTPEELLGPGGKARAGKVEAKYRHPDDPALTWTGRGKRPAWLTEALAAGKTLDDFVIA
jgi:DNA-binding protein H-NS